MMEDHIKVVCRVRPLNSKSLSQQRSQAVTVHDNKTIVVNSKPSSQTFSFDYIANELVTQEEMFETIGLPIIKTCMEGYNATILCYGQTNSGKSHTIFGNSETVTNNERGLVPRVFEYLWQHISAFGIKNTNFKVHCSFYEIYQERVYDLLDGKSSNDLQVREDTKLGVFVDGITEELVSSPADASRILAFGYTNRHVGATTMNRESSRSHAVFLLTLKVIEEQENGTQICRRSRFSLVDLAGSERQRDTNASGEQLKEASQINKSLSALGNVINSLCLDRNSTTNTRPRHVQYRDSKLTFLLRDSIGGNSKTVLIATVTPAETCLAETLSTLKFAQRAKMIKNIARLNEESIGSVVALQKEISLLKEKLSSFENGNNFPINSISNNIKDDNDNTYVPNICLEEKEIMLSESLLRCKSSDELRLRTQNKSKAYQQRLEQSDKILLGLKMKLKMRDSEIQRYKNKLPENDEIISHEEQIKIEISAIREESQGEILKYRLMCEELERRTLNLDKAAVVDLSSVWTEDKENLFNHNIIQIVTESEDIYKKLSIKYDLLRNNEFNDKFDFSYDEAMSLRSSVENSDNNCKESTKLMEEERIKTSEVRINMIKLQDKYDSLLKQNDESMKEYEHQTNENIVRIESLNKTIDELNIEIKERDEAVQDKLGDLARTEDEIREAHRIKESSSREAFNKAMKDNMMLMQRCKEMVGRISEQKDDIQNKETEIESFSMNLSKANKDHELQTNELNSTIASLESKIEEKTVEYTNIENEFNFIKLQNNDLESLNKDMNDNNLILMQKENDLSNELQKIKFELDNSIEERENLFTQSELLLSERSILLTTNDSNKSNINDLNTQIEEINEKCIGLTNAVANITSDLVISQDKLNEEKEASSKLVTKGFEDCQSIELLKTENQNINQLQIETSHQLEEYKLSLAEIDVTVNSLIEETIEKEDTIKILNSNIENNHIEVERLNSLNAELNNNIETYSKEIHSLKEEIASSEEKFIDIGMKLNSKINILIKENEDLSQLLQSEQEELIKINSKMKLLEADINNKTAQIDLLQSTISNSISELEETKVIMNTMKENLENKIKIIIKEKDEISDNMKIEQDEVEKLTLSMIDLTNIVDNKDLEIENLSSELDSLKIDIQSLTCVYDKTSNLLQESENNIKEMEETMNNKLNNIIKETDNQVINLESIHKENTIELNSSIGTLQNEIKNINSKHDEIINNLNNQMKLVIDETNIIEKSLTSEKNETECLKLTIEELKDINNTQSSEISNLNNELTKLSIEYKQSIEILKEEKESIENKNEINHIEIERLNNTMIELSCLKTSEVDILKENISKLNKENILSNLKLVEMSNEIQLKQNEIIKLSDSIIEKDENNEAQIITLKEEKEEISKSLQLMLSEVNRLTSSINTLIKEKEEEKEKNNDITNQLSDLNKKYEDSKKEHVKTKQMHDKMENKMNSSAKLLELELDSLKSNLDDSNNKLETNTNEKNIIVTKLEEVEKSLIEMKEKLEWATNKNTALTRQVMDMQAVSIIYSYFFNFINFILFILRTGKC
jgi:chromosome segregation ATPase